MSIQVSDIFYHLSLRWADPELADQGKNPFILDSAKPKIPFEEYAKRENRYNILLKTNPDRAKELIEAAQKDVNDRWRIYEAMAAQPAQSSPQEKQPVSQ